MKTNLQNRILLSVIFISTLFFSAKANTNNFSISFSKTGIKEPVFDVQDNLWNINFSYDYAINNFISLGGYIGSGVYFNWYCFEADSTYDLGEGLHKINVDFAFSTHYGIREKINLEPLLFREDIPRFDIYITGQTGLISFFTEEYHVPKRGHFFDCALMSGFSLYFKKDFGLNTELGYRYFKYHNGFTARFGFIWKL